MAFADMFAPMRNFGSTAAATTQAEAARMGAQASKSRAETAESLAPWNMAATAVQGVGTLGGLAQKFMEMEQMRPQREAMTGYYEALTREKNDPANQLTKGFTAASTISKWVNDNYYSKGLQPPPEVIRSLKGQIWNSFGARAAPIAQPAIPSAAGASGWGGMPGQVQRSGASVGAFVGPGDQQYVFPTDMDPALAESSRNMAEIMTSAVTAGPTPERLKKVRDIAELAQNAVLRKLKSEEEFANTVGNEGILWLKKIAAFSEATKAATGAGLMANPDAPWFAGISRLLTESGMSEQDSTRLMTQVFGTEAPQVIKNLRLLATPRPVAGTGVPLDIEDLGLIHHQQQLGQVAGDVNPQEEALKFAKAQEAIARGETGEATDPAHQFLIRKAETAIVPGAPTQADSRRQAIAEEVWGRLGSPDETAKKMTVVKKRFPFLLKELGEGKLDSRLTGSRQKLLVIDMLLLRAGHSPFQARNLWKNHLDVAAGLSGLTGEAREAFKQKITHNLNRMSSAFGPISEGISEEEIATKGGVGQVPHATQGDILRQRGWGGEGVGGWLGEMGATAMSGFGNVAGGGYGGNRQELEAVAALLREPSGGRVITPTELKGLFKVGGTSGYLTFDDTFYRTTDLVAWEIDANLKAHIDENEGAGLDFWQAAEDIATQAAMVGVGTARVASAGAKALGGIAKLPGVSHVVKGAGSMVGPSARKLQRGAARVLDPVLRKVNPNYVPSRTPWSTTSTPAFVPTRIGEVLPKMAPQQNPLLYEELLRRGLSPRGLDWYGSPAEQPFGE